MPLPSESPLGSCWGRSCPSSGRTLGPWEGALGVVAVLGLGQLLSPAGQCVGRAALGQGSATLVGFGFNAVSAAVHGRSWFCVCVLGLQMLSVWWCGLDTGTAQAAFPLGDTESQSCYHVLLWAEKLCPSKQAFFSLSSPFSVLWACCWREDKPLVRQEGWFATRVGLVHLGGLFQP